MMDALVVVMNQATVKKRQKRGEKTPSFIGLDPTKAKS
jgi:hypothetical protein